MTAVVGWGAPGRAMATFAPTVRPRSRSSRALNDNHPLLSEMESLFALACTRLSRLEGVPASQDIAPKLTPGLKAGLAKADFKQSCVLVVDPKMLVGKLGPDWDDKVLESFQACICSVQAGDDLTCTCVVVAQDAESAEDARKLFDGCIVLCKYLAKSRKDVPKREAP